MDDYPGGLWWHKAALLAGTQWHDLSVAGMVTAPKQHHLEMTGPFYCVTSPVPLGEGKQESSFTQGSAAPELHGCDELEPHWGCHMGVKSVMLRQQHWVFFNRTKSKKLFRMHSVKRSTAKCSAILLLTVNAELIYQSFLTFSISFPCHSWQL